MSTGRSKKLVGQAGEYLVAGELARRGYISTTFTGNVPHFDIVAANELGKHLSVQVKTISGRSWQFTITSFCEVTFDGDSQVIGAMRPCPVQDLVCVMVMLEDSGADRYFVLSWEQLRDITVGVYRRWLDGHGGVRPKKPSSLHVAILPQAVEQYEGNWQLITDLLA